MYVKIKLAVTSQQHNYSTPACDLMECIISHVRRNGVKPYQLRFIQVRIYKIFPFELPSLANVVESTKCIQSGNEFQLMPFRNIC